MDELRDGHILVSDTRLRVLETEAVRNLLRQGPVTFIVADVGLPLRWITEGEGYTFWKDEASLHLIEPDAWRVGIVLHDLRDEYGYVASEWLAAERRVVLLEKVH